MRTVWKYNTPVPSSEGSIFNFGEGAKIIHVAKQQNSPRFWVELDPKAPTCLYEVITVGTGWNVPEGYTHVGTFLDDGLVWHVYYREIK